MNRAGNTAQSLPCGNLAAEYLCQLLGIQLIKRVARVKDNGQSVDGDDLLGIRALQVAQGFEFNQFTVLDRP